MLDDQEKLYRGADHPRLVPSLVGMGKVCLAQGSTIDPELLGELRVALAKATR